MFRKFYKLFNEDVSLKLFLGGFYYEERRNNDNGRNGSM